jgi:hypothetical protein
LFKELNQGANPEPLLNILDYQYSQIDFLEGYQYPLNGAERLLGGDRRRTINYAKRIIEDIEAGRLEDWQELLEKDLVYMKLHS